MRQCDIGGFESFILHLADNNTPAGDHDDVGQYTAENDIFLWDNQPNKHAVRIDCTYNAPSHATTMLRSELQQKSALCPIKLKACLTIFLSMIYTKKNLKP